LVNYITNTDNFYPDAPVPKVKTYFFDSKGKPYDFTKDYRVGIIYLGDPMCPYVPKKKAGTRSMKAVFRRINYLRSKVYNHHAFEKQINYWKCKNCTITKQCLNDIERGKMGLEHS
jgi:hypothetical protein